MGRSGFRGAMRAAFSRDRVTGQVALGLVGLLLVTAVVYGVGIASAKYRLADVGAWLTAKSKGVLVHVNGPAAKVDGKAALLPQMRNHRIKVVQDGNTVLLVDLDTGVVSRIDPSQLKVTQSKALGGLNLQVLAEAGKAYTVDPVKGAVQQIDPVSLTPVGPSAVLSPPLEEAGVDVRGTLWVPVPQLGEVTPFRDGRLLPTTKVGKAGDRLSLVMAAGEPVVVNSTAANATVFGSSGVRLYVRLPSTVRAANAETLVPARTEGTVIPLLVQSTGALTLLDSGTGRHQGVALKLPKHRYQPPQILGPRIYVPDESLGQLHVYNTATGSSEKAIPVAGRNSSLEVFVKEGMLWAHDPGQPKAVVVDGNGAASAFGKYETKIPGGDKRQPLPSGGSGDGRTPPPGPSPDLPSSPPRPPGAPTPPTQLTTRFEGGAMRIGFKPSRGGTPTGYVIKDVPQGLTASPRSIPVNVGALEFSVAGGDCDKEYRFRVAVQYRDAQGRASELASDPSPPVRPCTAPLSPRNVKAEATAQGAKISWEPGAGTDDPSTRYQVSSETTSTLDIKGTSIVLSDVFTNGQYSFHVGSSNGAGGNEGTSINVTLTGPAQRYPIQHNGSGSTAYVRAKPDKESAQVFTYKDNGHTLTVLCQVKGANYTHPNNNPDFAGNLYNKVRTPKGDGYMIGYLAKTPNSAGSGWKTFLGLPLWRCE
ncbi:fibronectin type III domain-containing protein [Actinomadura rudentiformis]|uniref:Fibronectin type III domain-containing protein n=1 Tax=Actinomadura rudentiformis TaxID=359158 RepID=A0A6H9YH61_9ACTN|nr:fibronectin type III domain-containing protein [Actinomadura rudentiformis]KAB2345126.1 fibronectin type III domain-containing protein [Actinomadura rudentiformis]